MLRLLLLLLLPSISVLLLKECRGTTTAYGRRTPQYLSRRPLLDCALSMHIHAPWLYCTGRIFHSIKFTSEGKSCIPVYTCTLMQHVAWWWSIGSTCTLWSRRLSTGDDTTRACGIVERVMGATRARGSRCYQLLLWYHPYIILLK